MALLSEKLGPMNRTMTVAQYLFFNLMSHVLLDPDPRSILHALYLWLRANMAVLWYLHLFTLRHVITSTLLRILEMANAELIHPRNSILNCIDLVVATSTSYSSNATKRGDSMNHARVQSSSICTISFWDTFWYVVGRPQVRGHL